MVAPYIIAALALLGLKEPENATTVTPTSVNVATTTLPSGCPINIDSLLPLTGPALIGTLRCALDMASNAPRGLRRQHREDYSSAARGLLRFLTQNNQAVITSSEGSSQESNRSPVKRPRVDEDDFCEPSTSFGSGRRTSLETMRKIVQLSETRSEAKIKKMYPWYRRQYLSDFKRCVDQGGSHSMLREQINEAVRRNADELLDNNLPLKTYMLKAFGRREAKKLDADWFKASDRWVKLFKKNNHLSSRKVTKRISRPRIDNEQLIEENLMEFLNDYARISANFHPRLIWNIDQTGVEYESSNERVVGRTGSRDVLLRVDSLNKNSHSFTAQPIITRDGRVIGKLTLCLQEETNDFGPIVQRRVRDLESQYGNVYLLSSRSGKMTSNLMINWIRNVLRPTLANEINRIESGDIDEGIPIVHTRETAGKRLLLLTDSWSGQTSERVRQDQSEVFTLIIPAHTTGELQPLDIGFFRQLKIFIRRITEEALVAGRVADISSREGTINLMSLIHNQLKSPAYHDLWRFAWRHTDPFWNNEEIAVDRPSNVNSIQFGDVAPTCQIQNCTNEAVVQCSHDGVSMCLEHFLNRSHFHEIDTEGDRIDLNYGFGPGYDEDDEDDDYEELMRYVSEPYPLRNLTRGTSTTTPEPLMQKNSPLLEYLPFNPEFSFMRKRRFVGSILSRTTKQPTVENTK